MAQYLSVAEKLYDVITASPRLGNEKIKKIWNLEKRVYAVTKFLELVGTQKDHNPTYNTDLETLTMCVTELEKKSKTAHWNKVYSNEKRRLQKAHVDNAIENLKSYIGTEARKKDKRYSFNNNTIGWFSDMDLELNPTAYQIPKSLEQKIIYA